ncbi:uncharacterized protein LOC104902557 isoform X2 [Beta vulgaris subsp. vulgaris]|uniref:uncharacterized protein LOC104902557 isoform X2 n=1 Tax=Beta vulgaris subsp. vulgaris TaxID=3555 RepID=UPI0020367690|nr:uncharacterized protein LOC104902557 isoform X2 [Beta vulgaris subsp. vulgaris]
MSMAYEEQGRSLYNNINNYYKTMMMQRKPTNFFNSIFMSTVNMATNMLLSVVSKNYTLDFSTPNNINNNKWTVKDHMRFVSLLFTWFTMWVLRLVNDFIPSVGDFLPNFLSPHNHQLSNTSVVVHGNNTHRKRNNNQMQQMYVDVGESDNGVLGGLSSTVGSSSSSSSSSSLELVTGGCTSRISSSTYSPVQNLDLISYDGFLIDGYDRSGQAGQSIEALTRALSHILALLNELPATSRKYEFAIAMADRLLDENTRDGKAELFHVNRIALSSAFECTINRLHRTLNNAAKAHANEASNRGGPWSIRAIRKLPLGSYIAAYMKGGLSAVFPALQSLGELQKRRSFMVDDSEDEYVGSDQSVEVVGAEKLAQELLWIMHKLRACHAVDEALVQWSLASNLASLSLNVNPRLQALLIKISVHPNLIVS